jgi:hypothetical protein
MTQHEKIENKNKSQTKNKIIHGKLTQNDQISNNKKLKFLISRFL